MSRRSRKEVLDGERAVNERYIHELEAWLARTGRRDLPIAIAQNAVWNDAVPKAAPGKAVIGPVIGRVALGEEDEILGNNFYVGTWRRDWDGVEVVSWAAPVAKLFFDGRAAKHAGDIDPSIVSARRSFRSKNRDLADYEDDLEPGVRDNTVFIEATSELVIPAAPKVIRPSLKSKPTAEPQPQTDEKPKAAREEPKAAPKPAERVDLEEPDPLENLRAGRLVFDAISKPRTTQLGSVLATLQPDQFRLVTWPSHQPLVVQGQPGSGKTIVATHRAGYLTHRDREAEQLKRIAVIGPSPQWKEHVTASIADVGGEGVSVFCLPDLMEELSFGLNHELHLEDEHYLDTDWKLGRLADRAVAKLRPKFLDGGRDFHRARLVINELAKQSPLHQELVTDPDLSAWLLGAKSWDYARQQAKYLPFLAAVGLAVKRPTLAQRFEHLIVDEAQDVRPLEWRILSQLLTDDGSWSLFGDLHQRRSDFSPPWNQLEEYLEISVEEEILTTGFRSTNEILKFASRLLPKEARNIAGLRSGPQVDVTRTSLKNLIGVAVENVSELLEEYPEGTVAVIAMEDEVEAVTSDLMAAGWRRTHERSVLGREDRKVGVYRPVQARGLEFDGVVVVEPAAFPENLGRRGRLFTSLTRANQELRIVHSRGMPKELK